MLTCLGRKNDITNSNDIANDNSVFILDFNNNM